MYHTFHILSVSSNLSRNSICFCFQTVSNSIFSIIPLAQSSILILVYCFWFSDYGLLTVTHWHPPPSSRHVQFARRSFESQQVPSSNPSPYIIFKSSYSRLTHTDGQISPLSLFLLVFHTFRSRYIATSTSYHTHRSVICPLTVGRIMIRMNLYVFCFWRFAWVLPPAVRFFLNFFSSICKYSHWVRGILLR